MLIPQTIHLGDGGYESPFRFWLNTGCEKYVLFKYDGINFTALSFPSIRKENLDQDVYVKTSNILIRDEVYFFDPNYLREYEKITEPLYYLSKENPNMFIFSGIYECRVHPDQKTIERAIQYFNDVVQKMISRKKFDKEFSTRTKDNISSLFISFLKEDLKRLEGEYAILYCYIENNYRFTGIIIDKTKILPHKHSVTIKVAKPFFKEIIGCENSNIKRLEKELGLKHIKVKK
ncbi:MAG: hypothetical protein K0R72_764 [Clostridia bacterium]|jgi:hypothetical protein|nr:hypothetical protein [Clostridia bacterium]